LPVDAIFSQAEQQVLRDKIKATSECGIE
jgi:hypothetical protein